MSEKVQKILDEIKELTLLEASQLVKGLEDAFGVSAAAAAPGYGWAVQREAVRQRQSRRRRNFLLS